MCLFNVGILDSDSILQSRGNVILACAEGSDSYETWADCFAPCWKYVNQLEKDKKIEVDGVDIEIEPYLGAC
jgi:hypothetical protein